MIRTKRKQAIRKIAYSVYQQSFNVFQGKWNAIDDAEDLGEKLDILDRLFDDIQDSVDAEDVAGLTKEEVEFLWDEVYNHLVEGIT